MIAPPLPQAMIQTRANKLSASERELLDQYRQLPDSAQQSLLDFCAYLLERQAAAPAPEPASDNSPPPSIPEPEFEPGPAGETVIAAIRRLSRVYPMVDKATMLTETSELMTAHVMRGESAESVIEQLEKLFAQRYLELVEARQ